MARSTSTSTNEQKSEAQRSDSQTSADSTSLITPSTNIEPLSAKDEQAQVKAQVDKMLGNEADEDLPGVEKGKFKTLGAYMLHDPTTGDSVTEDGDEVRISAFIQKALDDGRIVKA